MSLFALWPEPLSREQEAVANSVIALDPSITRREANRVARRPRTKKSRAALARALSGSVYFGEWHHVQVLKDFSERALR